MVFASGNCPNSDVCCAIGTKWKSHLMSVPTDETVEGMGMAYNLPAIKSGNYSANYSSSASYGNFVGYNSLSYFPQNHAKQIFSMTTISAMPLYDYSSTNSSLGKNPVPNYSSSATTSSSNLEYMANIYVDRQKKKSAVMRDFSDIDADSRRGITNSLNAAKRKVAESSLPYSLKHDAYKNLDASEQLGKIFMEYVRSERSSDLLKYLAKKGYSEGIEKLLVFNEGSKIIAGTNPKSKPGLLLVDYSTLKRHIYETKKRYSSLTDRMIIEDAYAHELVHQFLHGQDHNPLQHEIEVEKTLAMVYSFKASKAKNSVAKKQYLDLANDHINRYLNHRMNHAKESGENFNPEADLEALYADYVAEFGNRKSHENVEAGKIETSVLAEGEAQEAEAQTLEAIVEGS